MLKVLLSVLSVVGLGSVFVINQNHNHDQQIIDALLIKDPTAIPVFNDWFPPNPYCPAPPPVYPNPLPCPPHYHLPLNSPKAKECRKKYADDVSAIYAAACDLYNEATTECDDNMNHEAEAFQQCLLDAQGDPEQEDICWEENQITCTDIINHYQAVLNAINVNMFNDRFDAGQEYRQCLLGACVPDDN